MNALRVAGFLDHSTVNGEGFRTTIFLSGCYHNCPKCHNEAMQSFDYGDEVLISDLLMKIKKNLPLIDGVTFSGGDPLEQSDRLLPLLQEIKSLGLSIWVYTGYTYSQAQQRLSMNVLLPFIDVLVEGKYIDALRDDSLKYIGSSNQKMLKLLNGRILDELKY